MLLFDLIMPNPIFEFCTLENVWTSDKYFEKNTICKANAQKGFIYGSVHRKRLTEKF